MSRRSRSGDDDHEDRPEDHHLGNQVESGNLERRGRKKNNQKRIIIFTSILTAR
jgi:hypothetical protein